MSTLSEFFSEEQVLSQKRIGTESRLKKILEVSLKKNRVGTDPVLSRQWYWDTRRFSLHQSTVFDAFPFELKESILSTLSRYSLKTSHAIERGAITYCARMALLSETLDEKAFFLTAGQEEVLHLIEFEKFLDPIDHAQPLITPFTRKLHRILQDGDRLTGFLVAQVLLEGMAMNHYEVLWDQCIDSDLKKVLERVLNDEARHHGAGLVLLDEASITVDQMKSMAEITREVIPLLVGQKNFLLDTLSRCASALAFNLQPEAIEKLSQEIHLDSQMDARLTHIRKSIQKLKNTTLRNTLLQIPELNHG